MSQSCFAQGILTAGIAMLHGATALAQPQDNPLYRTSLIVTGDREETRIPAIPEGFLRAAQKLSGNPDIAENPAFATQAETARGFVWSYSYHDRMFGRPIHDEQGTRDRPFSLTLQFDETMMNQALQKLGETPWTGPRPKLGLLVGVKDMARTYILARDGTHGEDQRASFDDASERFALPIIFPTLAELSKTEITEDGLDSISSNKIERLKLAMQVDQILLGHLEWNSKVLGWQLAHGNAA